jgi:hypothetical protein
MQRTFLALRCALRLYAKRGALPVPIGEAGQIRGTNKEISLIFFSSPCFAHKQSRNHERIGKVRKHILPASPIFT